MTEENALVERGTMKAREISVGKFGINFSNAAEVMAFAKMMATSGPAVRPVFRDNSGACLALIDDAIRFGVSPYFLARKAYFVNDQLAYEAQVIAAVVIARAPILDRPSYQFTGSGADLQCTVTVTSRSGEVISHTSPKFKDIQPKNSPLWKTDPEQQIGYYTVRAMARRHFPDVLGGVYDLEEAYAARTIDVTPKTDVGKIYREAKEGPSEASNAETPPAPAGQAEPDLAETEFLESVARQIALAATPDEVRGIADEYSAAIKAFPSRVALQVSVAVERRLVELGEPPKRKRGRPPKAKPEEPKPNDAVQEIPPVETATAPEETSEAPPDDVHVNGDKPDAPVQSAPALELTEDERIQLADLRGELAATASQDDVEAVWSVFEEFFAHSPEHVQQLAKDRLDNARKRIGQ